MPSVLRIAASPLGLLVALSLAACSQGPAGSSDAGGPPPGPQDAGGTTPVPAPACTHAAPKELARFPAAGYPYPRALVLTRDALFLATETHVWRVPREGGAPQELAGDQPARGGASVLAVQGDVLYRGRMRTQRVETHPVGTTTGAWSELSASLRADAPSLAVAGQKLFTVGESSDPRPLGSSWLASYALDGSGGEVHVEGDTRFAVMSFAAAEQEVFVVVAGKGLVRIADGAQQVMGPSSGEIVGQDADAIYTQSPTADGRADRLFRQPRTGGAAVQLAEVPGGHRVVGRGAIWTLLPTAPTDPTALRFVRVDASTGAMKEVAATPGPETYVHAGVLALDEVSLYAAILTPSDEIVVLRASTER